MTADLEIRRYRPGDRERVETIVETALRDAGAYFEDAPDGAEGPIEGEYLESGGEFLVGEVAGTVVATGAFRPVAGIVAASLDSIDDTTIETKRMHVHPDHQRRGFGQQILDELQHRARSRGYDELVLNTTDLQTAACRFYEDDGFEVLERDSITAFDRSFDVAIHRKALSAAAE